MATCFKRSILIKLTCLPPLCADWAFPGSADAEVATLLAVFGAISKLLKKLSRSRRLYHKLGSSSLKTVPATWRALRPLQLKKGSLPPFLSVGWNGGWHGGGPIGATIPGGGGGPFAGPGGGGGPPPLGPPGGGGGLLNGGGGGMSPFLGTMERSIDSARANGSRQSWVVWIFWYGTASPRLVALLRGA